MQDLIGDVELDDRLRQQGEDDDRKERERRGWDMAQAAPTTSGVFGGGSTRRWRCLARWRRQLTWGLQRRAVARSGGETSPTRSVAGRATRHVRPR